MSGNVVSGRTHCRKGHEYTRGNTRWWKGTRQCLTCLQERERQAKERRQRAREATQ